MRFKVFINIFLVICFSIFSLNCNNHKEGTIEIPAVNLDHLMHLYDDVDLPGNLCGGILHIYSEYPDYQFEIEPNEGFTCVDDVARAMMIDDIRFSNDAELMKQYNSMTEFLLYMQAENGYFYNFIWPDLSINKTYRTSLAEPNWWSWRAFWALANYNGNDHVLAEKAKLACDRLAENLFQLYLNQPKKSDTIEGIEIPTWLPLKTAGDQAALLILGLEPYYQQEKKDERSLQLIKRLADGLLKTQKGDAETFPYGVFLSWENLWHAYGNGQAYAMLRAGQLLNRPDYIESALKEINQFYPFLRNENYTAVFRLKKTGDQFEIVEQHQFPQIAYGFRPMIWACAEAYKISGDEVYLKRAKEIATWFTGKNIANQQMYNPATGRCYDGIVSKSDVNMNSGAESTIEALLSLQVFNQIYHE
jgi:hypothetical protein